ncbi:MAG TPA: leucyl aminopeptidase family protein [Kiloniellales bacterium]|nr:leucyl aminopeptidase family protein [Kiloniellales bacterium]
MTAHLLGRASAGTVPITPLAPDGLKDWLAGQPERVRAWVESTGFGAEPGAVCLLPAESGTLARVLAGIDPAEELWSWAALPARLPAGETGGRYALDATLAPESASRAALGWALGTYRFARYRKAERRFPALVWPKGAERDAVERTVRAVFLVRDLINTPAEDLGPEELAAAARRLAREHGAAVEVTTGTELLAKNYPAIHAVGRASAREPRLIDLRWGEAGPRVALVGKGVCFDSGGLDLKSSGNMKLMKKDMGGAAHVLGLASMIMTAGLKLRLRVLVPAVENSVSGNAMRPLDVLATRKGMTVEVGDTDAEGRLILCDALAEADRDEPDLVVDFATLTGAARVALGPDVPAVFCNDEGIAEALLEESRRQQDPVWRLPLHRPYRKQLDSKVADICNIASGPFGGAIVAALFLAEFLRPETRWVHLDLMAWNLSNRPGRPEGGEAMGLRAVYGLIEALAEGRVPAAPPAGQEGSVGR